MQLSCALANRAGVVVQQDIRGFFDAIRVPDAIAILTHLRAPAPFIKLFGVFYERCRRIFVLKGAHDASWFEPTRGIAQGCPFSPCIAAAITHIWCCHVLKQGVGGLGYMDDRTIWMPPSTPFDQLQSAIDRSGQFDQAMGFQVAIDKCRIVALQTTPEITSLAQTLGYAIATDVEFLGICCTLDGTMSLLKFHAMRAAYRLRLLKWAAPNIETRRKMILSLVIPSFTWAAGWALPTSGEMTTLKQEILQAFTDLWGQQPATILAFERIGWKCEPNFAGDLALLRIAWRSHAKTPQWLELSPIAQAFPSASNMLPLLGPQLHRLGWHLNPDGATFVRLDDEGRQRSLRAGFEHFRYLADWLLQHHRKVYVGKCGRVQKRYHREGQDLAQGLDLPPPSPADRFLFKGHGSAFQETMAGHNASLQAEDILQSSFGTRLRYFALGDWNCGQTQNSIGQLIANGIARAADDCADGRVLPCTGPGRRRRIDYGACHWQLPATSVRHYSCHVSDHLVVQYQCDLQAPRCRTGPRRLPVGEVSDESLDLYFATWHEQPFHDALCHCDVDAAWAFLCNHAESALCETVDDNAIPRCAQWQPSAPKPSQRPGKGQVGSEVVSLLRNLLNKLQVLCHRPWDLQLAQRVLRSLPKLRILGADLPFVDRGDELSLIESASSQLKFFEQQEQKALKEEWSRRLKTDEATLRSFVKNRAESQLEWEEAYPQADAVVGGLHPAHAVAAESEAWRGKWTSEEHTCNNALLASVLDHVPRPSPSNCDLKLETCELRAAMSSMKDRSGGPDDWKASHLLRMPLQWWHLFTSLWNHCIEHGALPQSWRDAKVV